MWLLMICIVWDAAKETADIYSFDVHYNTKKLTVVKMQTGVKATAIVNMSCDTNPYASEIISPGSWAEKVKKAKDEEALHDQEKAVEAVQPVEWYAVDESPA